MGHAFRERKRACCSFFFIQLLIRTRLDADVACVTLDYTYSSLIGMVKAQYYRCLPFP